MPKENPKTFARLAVGVVCCCLLSTAGAQEDPAIYLQALVPTSGQGGQTLLSGAAHTGWRPLGDPSYEGVLFRFEKQIEMDKVRVVACKGSGAFRLVPFFNSVTGKASRHGDEHRILLKSKKRSSLKVKSLFVRIEAPQGDVCLSEVVFELGGKVLPVRAPRKVEAAVEVSSTLSPAEAYHQAYLFDNRFDFGWVEGAKDLGVGQSVTIRLNKATAITAIEIWNGYQRSRDHFRKNARAKLVDLSIDGGKAIPLKLKDKMGPQKIQLGKTLTGSVLVLTIRKAFRGSRYKDLVISELRLWDDQGPLGIATPGMEELQKALVARTQGSKIGGSIDRHWVGACEELLAPEYGMEHLDKASVRGHLKLRSNHTFVYYQQYWQNDGASLFHEVFDGTWVPEGEKKKWSQIKLFGRRLTKEKDVDFEYNLSVSGSRTRIGGGGVQLAFVGDLSVQEFKQEVIRWMLSAAARKVGCLFPQTYFKSRQADFRKEDLLMPTEEEFAQAHKKLSGHSAIIVKGRAITDLLWQK